MSNKCSFLSKGWKSVGNVRYRKPLCDVNAGANALHVKAACALIVRRILNTRKTHLSLCGGERTEGTVKREPSIISGLSDAWFLLLVLVLVRIFFSVSSPHKTNPPGCTTSCRSTFLCQSRVDQQVHSIICYFLCKPL